MEDFEDDRLPFVDSKVQVKGMKNIEILKLYPLCLDYLLDQISLNNLAKLQSRSLEIVLQMNGSFV